MEQALWINGLWVTTAEKKSITSPFSGQAVSSVHQGGESEVRMALAAADEARIPLKKISRSTRSLLLTFIAAEISRRSAEFVAAIINEAGKPRSLASGEVSRAITTFTLAAEEAKRYGGEFIPMDIEPGSRAYADGYTFFEPRGVVLAIAPFNFPLNLIAHKVAPALATGCPVIIKPPPQAPGAAHLLAQAFAAGYQKFHDDIDPIPSAALQVINCSNELASKMVTDERVAILSFTGSDVVGWKLQKLAVGKKVSLELGGNAGLIIHSDADLERAATRATFGAFAYAGQVCISVQRIFIQEDVYDEFSKLLITKTEQTPCGDPDQSDTVVGPLIDSSAATRLNDWQSEALKDGGRLLSGGKFDGNVMTPTILENVKTSAAMVCNEAFGPVVVLERYQEFSAAIAAVNNSRFGLQAGIFTENNRLIREAIRDLETGGIIINDVPTFRADHMPYGGIRESGLGREGVKYAMHDYSELKTVVQFRT